MRCPFSAHFHGSQTPEGRLGSLRGQRKRLTVNFYVFGFPAALAAQRGAVNIFWTAAPAWVAMARD
jgi:hypothetical protein